LEAARKKPYGSSTLVAIAALVHKVIHKICAELSALLLPPEKACAGAPLRALSVLELNCVSALFLKIVL
jgi:hypothetical protein